MGVETVLEEAEGRLCLLKVQKYDRMENSRIREFMPVNYNSYPTEYFFS
jgi:hypothetical protein